MASVGRRSFKHRSQCGACFCPAKKKRGSGVKYNRGLILGLAVLGNSFTSFISNVLSEVVAGIILLSIPLMLTYFFKMWVWENIVPLLIGFLTGSVVIAFIAFIFSPNPPSTETAQTVQAPQPSTPPTPEPLMAPPPSRVPMPSPSAEPTLEQSIYPFTPESIAASLATSSSVFIGETARPKYYGKYVRWTGTIKHIEGDVVVWEFIVDQSLPAGQVHALLKGGETRYLAIGKDITVTCSISAIAGTPYPFLRSTFGTNPFLIRLNDCTLHR